MQIDIGFKNKTDANKANTGELNNFDFVGNAEWRKEAKGTGFVAWRTNSILDVINLLEGTGDLGARFTNVTVTKPKGFKKPKPE